MESTIIYLAAFVTLLAVAVAAAVLVVRRDGRGVGDLVTQFIVWVGIAALLPLSSWAGGILLHPRARIVELTEQRNRVQQETYDTKDPASRGTARDEQQRLTKQINEEQRLFYRAMFRVAFPVGLAALVAGLFVRTTAVGTALAFGGLCTLTAGCYSYWDDMGDAVRFFSLFVVLIILIAIGLAKFGRPNPPAPVL